jgi:hypothetical protein
MKINTRKLLLFLFTPGTNLEPRLYLPYLWPTLSPSGRRSLVSQLIRQQLITRQTSGKLDFLALTAYGEKVVQETFPLLLNVRGQGEGQSKTCLVLHTPPAFDHHFIKLRQRLRVEKIPELTPSTYLAVGSLSGKLAEELSYSYFPYVAVFPAGKWQIGNEESFFSNSGSVNDLRHLISGISSHIDQLTDSKITFFTANHQAKLTIISVYERIFNCFEQAPAYFSISSLSSTSGKEVLERFKRQLFIEP